MESSLKASIHMAKITGFVVDLVPLLAPLTQDEPCGPSLRYTDTFAQIKEARSEDDASLPMGEWVRPLKKADWRAVESLCVDAIVCRSKDLQIAGWLTETWIHLYGMDGFIAGTRLLIGLCQSYWQALHPLFEPDEADLRAAPFVWANDVLSHTLLLHLPLLPWPDMAPPFINLDQWGDIQNKPNTFPSTWDQVSNKPNLNPSAETILNKIVVADGQVLTTEDNADLVRLLLHLSDRESLKQPLALSGRLILTASVMSYGVLLTIWDL